MKYIEVTVETEESGIEAVMARMMLLGIDNIEVQDPEDIRQIMDKKESYEWDYIEEEVAGKMAQSPKLSCYFESGEEAREMARAIKKEMEDLREMSARGELPGLDLGRLSVTIEEKDDADWKDKWKEYFKPSRISKRIVVKPTWEFYQPKGDDLVIEIDPGMAFGTGTHETTSMCIRLLERWLKPGDSVLDAGTGSGILAIAAAKLGARSVLGVDIDREAVRVAGENVALNHEDAVCRIEYGDVTKGLGIKADLVVANLMAELIMMLAGDIWEHTEEGGIFISSGILTDKEPKVLAAIEEAGFRIIDIMRDGEWSAITARKENR